MRLMRGYTNKDMPPEFIQRMDLRDMIPDQRPTITDEGIEYDYNKPRDHTERAQSFQEKLKATINPGGEASPERTRGGRKKVT